MDKITEKQRADIREHWNAQWKKYGMRTPEKPKDRTGLVQINREGIITTVQYDDETVCGIKIVHDLKEAKKESVKIEFGKY